MTLSGCRAAASQTPAEILARGPVHPAVTFAAVRLIAGAAGFFIGAARAAAIDAGDGLVGRADRFFLAVKRTRLSIAHRRKSDELNNILLRDGVDGNVLTADIVSAGLVFRNPHDLDGAADFAIGELKDKVELGADGHGKFAAIAETAGADILQGQLITAAQVLAQSPVQL